MRANIADYFKLHLNCINIKASKIDMARQKGGFVTFVTGESRVIRDWTFEGSKNYTMDVIGVIGAIMWFKTVRDFFDAVIGVNMRFKKKKGNNMTLWLAWLTWLCDSVKNWRQTNWHCDWRDWRNYVVQKKNENKYDAVIGVIDVIMWFKRKKWKNMTLWLAWLCDSVKKLKNFDTVIGVIDVIV